MAETRFHVVYQGELLPGADREIAKQKLMRAFGLSTEKAEKVLNSRGAVLKKGVDKGTAEKYATVLEKAGLRVAVMEADTQKIHLQTPDMFNDADGEGPRKNEENRPSMEENAEGHGKMPPLPPIPADGVTSHPFLFTGNGSEYFKIWIVNIVLSIVTLGIYSAWAKVRRKQYFYGSTRIRDANFAYLADPLKILKGRIIVVVLFIASSFVTSFFPVVGQAVLSIVFLFLLPWLVVRSLAFNAHNSAIRNIRFRFHGTVFEAAKVYVLWPLVASLTLGLLFPYVYFRQKKFIVENTSYGTTRFTFSATSSNYYGIFLSALLPVVVGVALVVGSGFLFPPLAVISVVVVYLYLFAFYTVKTTNLLFNATQLASHGFKADLGIKDYMILVFTNTLAIALTMGLFHPWAKVRTVRYKTEHLTLIAAGDLARFVAEEQEQVSAFGDEMSDFLDFDFGI